MKENGTPIILYGRLYTKYETVINEVDTFVDVQPNSVYSTGHEVIVPASGETAEDISRASFVAKSGILLGGDLNIIVPDDYINPVFLALTISNGNQQKELSKRAQGKSVVHIHNSDLENVVLLYPKYEEQEKIGEYFSKLDSLITLHQREYFSFDFGSGSAKIAQNTLSWEQRKLSEISEKVSKKNQDMVVDEVFTNSAEFGIISQRDYFDKDIANSENIDGYYIVEPNDFVYNPRISTLAPFGPVRRNKLDKSGAMSPLYYVFRTYDVDCGYLEYFFKTNRWHSFMHLNGNSGARSDRFAIRDEVFRDMPISMPQDIEEQKKVGDFFSTLELAITLHQHKPTKKGHDVLTVMPFKGNQRKPHYLCT